MNQGSNHLFQTFLFLLHKILTIIKKLSVSNTVFSLKFIGAHIIQHSFFYASYLVSFDHLQSFLRYHPRPTRCFQLLNKVVLLLLNLSHKASRNLSLPYTLSSKSVSSNYKVFIQFMFLETSISLQFIPVKRFYVNIILKQSIQPHTKSPPVSQSLFSLEL